MWNFIVRQAKFRLLHPNEHPLRIFWYFVRLFDWQPSKIGTFLLNKPYLEMNDIDSVTKKIALLTQISNKKTNFRKVKLVLDLENWHWELKIASFWKLSSIKQSYKISKNPLEMFIWMQKSTEFHLPHYEIPKSSSRYPRDANQCNISFESISIRL